MLKTRTRLLPDGEPSARRQRGLQVASIATGLLVAVVMILAVEAVGRVTYPPDVGVQTPEWYELSRELGWVHRPGFAGDIFEAHPPIGR